jgi:hypothetical protein
VGGPLQLTDLENPKPAQLDKVLYKWLTAVHSERKPITDHTPIEKFRLFMVK